VKEKPGKREKVVVRVMGGQGGGVGGLEGAETVE